MKRSNIVIGDGHPEVVAYRNNLAWIYFRQAKYKEAQELYEHSLKIRKEVFGDDHPDIARSNRFHFWNLIRKVCMNLPNFI